jgi:hypothetical protein
MIPDRWLYKMNYKDFRKKKFQELGLRYSIWAHDEPSVFSIGNREFEVRYVKTGKEYEVYPGFMLYHYSATKVTFNG